MAQVPVAINSGNPKFPFPQFLSYDFGGTHSLGNLATQNAPGVVHAEMEKIMREAWQIEANRYSYTGDSWAGVNYIISNTGCPYDCSEGVGYALIAAAYMGDKTTFDGIWMREHDVRRVLQPSYRTGAIIRPGYQYGDNTIAEPGGDAATDGDVDIALGLLMAWKQWGDNSGYVAFNGQPISYKQEALDVIQGLVERKNRGFMSGSVADCRSVSGNVGFDGYLKNGNTGPGETTTFGSGDPLWCPEFGGPNLLHIDYAAPSYFYSFRNVMTTESMDSWEINQMYRAEASSDWIMGKLLNNPSGLPHAGWANVNGSNVTFSSFNLGEDFRAAWRTILNYVWHGDPTYTWDPVTHTVQNGVPNSFEQLIGKRFSNFLTDQRKAPWGNPCKDLGGGPDLTYSGPPITSVQYDPNTGDELFPLPINWGMATSAPSTIAAQDYDLMGDMFRQCAIEWDITAAGDRYLTSKPVYFHGFFRLLGMLILSGNFQDPLVAKPIANLKIYRAVDKTYGYTGDQFQFTLSYRNYGTLAATGVQIVETLPANFIYVAGSASNGGVYNAGTHSITWAISGSVPGFSTAGGIAPTQGIRTYKLQAGPNADGRYCATATISASNSKSWTTNEYPNNVTEVMERNCIDIVKRALLIDKSVNYAKVQNNTEVKFKIDFENSSTAGWLNGGRPNVFFSYAQGTYGANGDTRGIKIRLFHGAAEPYINYKNYRISTFLNDNAYSCINGVGPCTLGWGLRNTIYEGGAATGVTFTQEDITPGTDARGKWNQRVIIQFADQIATTTPQLSAMYGMSARIHQGGTEPLRAVWDLYTSNYGAIDWSDDWSWDAAAANPDGGLYFPVTNDWTDPYNLNIPVTKWHKNACEVATKTVDNVLIEEWDGYTWRRVYGNGPLPGRDVANVIVRDTLPPGLTFNGWVQQTTLGVTATYDPATRVITWTIPKLQVGQKGSLEYKAIATFTTPGVCPKADQKHINSGWIQGDNESKKADTASVTVTCDAVILPPTPTTMTKTADKAAYVVGDPINYTIAYTQTHGAIIDASMSTAADWTQQIGTWNFGTKISNSTTNASALVTHKKAHGTNGTITGSLEIAASATFSIAFRQTGSTIASGSYISFKPNPGAGNIEVKVWNGTTQLGATQTIGYPGAPQNFKIVLNGNQLNLWMGSFAGSPTLTVTGITVQAGYIGFLNGTPTAQDTYANHNIVSLHSEMDSAWDIIISDPIPSELTFGTATGGTNTAGVISWPAIAGPVLAGTVITKTWTGTVASCAASGKIVNNAYANMLGQATNSIAAQSIVNCSGTTVCTKPTITSSATGSVCSGVAQNYAITSSLPSTYTWTRAVVLGISNIIGSGSTVTIAETLTNTTAAAIVVRYIITPTSTANACVGNPFNYDVTVNPKPTITGASTVCVGSTITLAGSATAHGTTPWTSASPLIATVTNAGVVTGVAAGTSVITYMNTNGCTETQTVTVNAKPIVTLISTMCVGSTITLAGSATAHATTPWTSATSSVATVTPAGVLTGVAAGTSVITYMNTNGCTQMQTITVNAKPTITGASAVCAGSTITLAGSATAHGTIPWVSATTTIATVTNAGVVTGVAAGTSVITYMNINGCTETQTITVTASPTASVAIATPSTTICTGTSITFTATPTNGGTPTYQWYKGSSPSGISLGAAATNATYTTTTAVNGDSYYVVMTSTAACASPAAATSNAIVITVTTAVTPAVTITAAPGNTICAGTSVTFTAVAGNGGLAPTYEWFVKKMTDATPQSQGAASTAATTFTSTTLTNGDEVSVLMTSNSGCVVAPGTATSNIVTMTVNSNVVPGVTIATPSTTICNGTSVTFTATPVNGGTPTYVWRKNGTAITPAATGSTYTTTTAANGDSYDVIMTSTAACASPATATSNAIVMTVTTVVTPAVSITAAPGNTICAGTSVTFTASPGNGGSAPTYQWFINNIPQGAATTTAITFTSTTLATGDQIKVIMTSNSGCVIAPGTATSNVITMTVNPVLVPAVAITVSPTGAICPGTSITFTAAPTNGGTPTYVWRKNGTPISPAATGATYTTTTAANGDSYDVVMTSTATCATPATATSNAIAITVTPVPTLAVSIVSDVTSICANNPVQFTATASGTGSTPAPTYEWFVTSAATATGGTSQGVASTTATTFTTSALTAANNRVYVQVVSNAACAATTAVASNVIAITVNAGIGAGTVGSDQSICYNTIPAALTQTVAPTSIAGTPTYQWEASLTSGGTFTAIPAATNIGYTAALAITQDVYIRRVITDPGTPVPCNVATSNTVHITVRPQLVAGVIGSDQTICSGSVPAVMTETTAPTGGTGTFTYQWQSDASGPFQNISGATNSSYTSTALTATTRFQRIETSGTCGSVTSNIVTKTISAPEVVTVSINDPGQVCDGSAAFAFVATAATTGTGTLSYAWTLNNGAVGTNSANYSYTPVIGDDNKTVKVVVTTSNGCNSGPATSNPVTLDIVGAATPTVTITTNNNPNCAGLISTFTATSTGGGSNPTYQWYVDPVGPTGPVAVGTGGTTYSTSTLANGDQVYVELTSNLGCLIGTNPFASNKITMVIKPIPAPAITEGDQTICTPNSFTFHGIVTAGNAYEWRDLSSNTVVGTSPDFPASQSGTYVLFEDNGTCNSTSQPVTLNVIQTPVANAGSDIYIREGDAGSLNGSGGAVYSWSPSTYLNNAGVSNPGFTATETITYTLTVSDASNTCSTTDNVTVTVVSPIIVPNIITVNGDGSNDDWYLKNIEGYPNCIIEIYNRWGNLVWKSEGYPKNWDGTNFRNGQVLPDGTYFYIINLQSQIYDEPLTGWVQIVK